MKRFYSICITVSLMLLFVFMAAPASAISVSADLSHCEDPKCEWQFGDGNSTTGCGAQDYSYSDPGTYNATFSVYCGYYKQVTSRKLNVESQSPEGEAIGVQIAIHDKNKGWIVGKKQYTTPGNYWSDYSYGVVYSPDAIRARVYSSSENGDVELGIQTKLNTDNGAEWGGKKYTTDGWSEWSGGSVSDDLSQGGEVYVYSEGQEIALRFGIDADANPWEVDSVNDLYLTSNIIGPSKGGWLGSIEFNENSPHAWAIKIAYY